MNKVDMLEQEPKKHPDASLSAPPMLGRSTGIVAKFHKTHGFIFMQRFGPAFVHMRHILDGRERLEVGQHVTARVRTGSRGQYADKVKVQAEQWYATPDDSPDHFVFPPRFIAATIAYCLDEEDYIPSITILNFVRHVGNRQAWAVLNEALQIEAQGGLLTHDGSRRRTLGGVFFVLAKNQVDSKSRYRIFHPKDSSTSEIASQEDATTIKPDLVKPQPVEPPRHETITWETRGDGVGLAPNDLGKATSAKVTIIGRPDNIIDRGNTIILMFAHQKPFPSLSRDLPVPEAMPKTTYVVYVAAKQWRSVAEKAQNPEDILIIEGCQLWDAEYEALAVYTSSITTNLQQQAKRASS